MMTPGSSQCRSPGHSRQLDEAYERCHLAGYECCPTPGSVEELSRRHVAESKVGGDLSQGPPLDCRLPECLPFT